jgi:hypothetical protein
MPAADATLRRRARARFRGLSRLLRHRTVSAASRDAASLLGQRQTGRGAMPFALQRASGGLRPFRGRPAAAMAARSVRLCSALASAGAGRAARRRFEGDPRAPRLRQADGNRLFGRARAVLAVANVLHFFAHEFAGLRAWRFALTFVAAGAFQRSFFRHDSSLFGISHSSDMPDARDGKIKNFRSGRRSSVGRAADS